MVVYDIEIKNAVPGKEPLIEGVEYCDGWHDHAGMGISVLCAYDYKTEEYGVFCDDNKEDFAKMIKDDVLIGFNSRNFDDNVLEKCWGIKPDKAYDIKAEIHESLGHPKVFNFRTHGGYGLDAMIKALIPNYGKTGNGADAPIWYQRGEWGKLVNYCLADVRLTKLLMDRILNEGSLVNPKTGGKIEMHGPVSEKTATA